MRAEPEIAAIRFRLEDGSLTRLAGGDPRLRHIDRAFAATLHAFQGKTVDRILAAMPTGNPNLTNQQAFYGAIRAASRNCAMVQSEA